MFWTAFIRNTEHIHETILSIREKGHLRGIARRAVSCSRLELPEGEPTGFALFAHCFTCSKDLFAPPELRTGLAERGVAVLRFDFTGLGHSDGEFEHTNFSSNIEDLIHAADFLRDEWEAPRVLIGHSFGGTASLVAAGRIDEVQAVTTIGAPCHPKHVEHVFAEKIDEIEADGAAHVTIAGREFTVAKHFLEDIRQAKMAEAIGSLGKPMLVFHSPIDDVVGIENAKLIYQAARHPKSFISLDQADHLLTDKEDAEFVADMLSSWVSRYVDFRLVERGTERPDDLDEPRPEEVLVAEARDGRYKNHVAVGRHHFIADEPVEVGGGDAGPNPYDLITAGLGACTSMTLRMYSERKGWPVESIEVRLEHEQIHARDCEDCKQTEGKLDKIHREITVTGELDEAQVQRLMEIADKCPRAQDASPRQSRHDRDSACGRLSHAHGHVLLDTCCLDTCCLDTWLDTCCLGAGRAARQVTRSCSDAAVRLELDGSGVHAEVSTPAEEIATVDHSARAVRAGTDGPRRW